MGELDVGEDGKQKIKAGFYHHQWKTQFSEKGLTVVKLQQKIDQLKDEIQTHESKIKQTQTSMSKWRSVGRMAAILTPSKRNELNEDVEKLEALQAELENAEPNLTDTAEMEVLSPIITGASDGSMLT